MVDDKTMLLKLALQDLEAANDALCAARTQDQYDAMLALGQQDLLLQLDTARRRARSALDFYNHRLTKHQSPHI